MTPTPEDFAHSRLIAYSAYQWPGYKPARHHRLIARHLEAVERGEITRLMIFMPPRAGKSMLVSEFFPSWYLGRNPSHYLIAATYAQELADDFGRKVRNQIADPSFQAIFPGCTLKGDSQASKRFHVTQKSPGDAVSTELDGAYFATGIGGPMSGRGSHLLLIDDAVKNREEAESATIRQRNKDWYTSTAYTRLMPGGKIVVVMTRWHDDDLAGWLLKSQPHENWKVLCLPAIAEVEDEIGRRAGDPLWPEAFPLDTLEKIKASIGSRDWTALYQQRPSPAEGGIFKAGWFRRYRERQEKYLRIVQSWDTAYKPGQLNDPSCCTTWGEKRDGFDLLHVMVKRLEYPDLKNTLIVHAAEWQPDAILIEDKASGQSLLQDLRRETQLPAIAITPRGDKETRASAVSALVEAGRVFVPEHAAWLTDFEMELMQFPNGVHDDQCFVAGTRISTKRGDINIEDIRVGDKAFTPDGWKTIIACGPTFAAEVIERSGLIGTRNHPVFTLDKGYVLLDTLTQGSTVSRLNVCGLIRITLLSTLNSMASPSVGWADVASTISRNPRLMRDGKTLKACMSLFGNTIREGQYRKATKSIMSTAIRLTSILTILSAYRLRCIAQSLASRWTWKSRRLIWNVSGRLQQLGTVLLKGLNGIGNMPLSPCTSTGLGMTENVYNAGPISNQPGRLPNIAAKGVAANFAGSTEIGTLGRQTVYNLTVADSHCYYANGILVHNCDSLSQFLEWSKGRGNAEFRIRTL